MNVIYKTLNNYRINETFLIMYALKSLLNYDNMNYIIIILY